MTNAAQELARQLLLLTLQLSVSVVVGFVPAWTRNPISLGEQLVLSVCLFTAFVMMDVLWTVIKSKQHQSREFALWRMRVTGDEELSNIRASFFDITHKSYGEKDLFVDHFMKKFRELAEATREVAEKSELRVQADHFLSVDNVLEAFHGDSQRIWRYTWPLNEATRLFDDLPWRRYFERTAVMVQDGSINEIRAILIVDKPESTSRPLLTKLLDFFHTHKNMDCRIITQRDYGAICNDNGIPQTYIDFGIYGTRLLFRTEQYAPQIVGVFTKDHGLIQMYTKLFDTMWNSPSTTKSNPSRASNVVPLEELFKYDEEQGP